MTPVYPVQLEMIANEGWRVGIDTASLTECLYLRQPHMLSWAQAAELLKFLYEQPSIERVYDRANEWT